MRSDADASKRSYNTIHNSTGTVTVREHNRDSYRNRTGQVHEQERDFVPEMETPDGREAVARAEAPRPAAPAVCSRMGRDALLTVITRARIPMSAEGLTHFLEQMKADGWMLYGKPVEKKTIARALRGWLKYHPQFRIETDSADRTGTDECQEAAGDKEAREDREGREDKNRSASDRPTFNSKEELLAVDGLRDKIVSEICRKTNEKNKKSFTWDTQEGLSCLVDYLKGYSAVLKQSHLYTEDELKAMKILWEVDTDTYFGWEEDT